MTRERLALLIPAYNATGHLPRLLASAEAQSEPFDEVWVYDDASSDATAEVARAHGARVVRGEVNRGCSFGKNELAARTTCEWVHFHDADDALKPGFAAAARRWMKQDAPDVVLFGWEERDAATGALIAVRRFDAADLRRDPISFVVRVKVTSIVGLYRRERFLAAGGYDLDPEVLYNEDVAMHCRLALAGLSFAADPEIGIVNFIQRASMSASNPVRCLRAHLQVMRKVAAATSGRYATEIAARCWIVAAGAATHLDWPTADASASLAVSLAGRRSAPSSRLFRALCALDVRAALRLRERLIRFLKPHLRRSSA